MLAVRTLTPHAGHDNVSAGFRLVARRAAAGPGQGYLGSQRARLERRVAPPFFDTRSAHA